MGGFIAFALFSARVCKNAETSHTRKKESAPGTFSFFIATLKSE